MTQRWRIAFNLIAIAVRWLVRLVGPTNQTPRNICRIWRRETPARISPANPSPPLWLQHCKRWMEFISGRPRTRLRTRLRTRPRRRCCGVGKMSSTSRSTDPFLFGWFRANTWHVVDHRLVVVWFSLSPLPSFHHFLFSSLSFVPRLACIRRLSSSSYRSAPLLNTKTKKQRNKETKRTHRTVPSGGRCGDDRVVRFLYARHWPTVGQSASANRPNHQAMAVGEHPRPVPVTVRFSFVFLHVCGCLCVSVCGGVWICLVTERLNWEFVSLSIKGNLRIWFQFFHVVNHDH